MDTTETQPLWLGATEHGPAGEDDRVIMGIDPSSKKLAVIVGTTDGTQVVGFTKLLRIGGDARDKTLACLDAFHMGTWLGGLYPKAVLIALEAPVLGRGGAGSTIPQAYTSGALQAGLTAAGLGSKVHLTNNQHWKITTVGRGNASKDDIADWVREEHRDHFELTLTNRGKIDQDVCDAIGIYHHAVGYYRTQRKLHRAFRRPPARRLTTTTEGLKDGDTRQVRSANARRISQGKGTREAASQGAIICGPRDIIPGPKDIAAVEDFRRSLQAGATAADHRK